MIIGAQKAGTTFLHEVSTRGNVASPLRCNECESASPLPLQMLDDHPMLDSGRGYVGRCHGEVHFWNYQAGQVAGFQKQTQNTSSSPEANLQSDPEHDSEFAKALMLKYSLKHFYYPPCVAHYKFMGRAGDRHITSRAVHKERGRGGRYRRALTESELRTSASVEKPIFFFDVTPRCAMPAQDRLLLSESLPPRPTSFRPNPSRYVLSHLSYVPFRPIPGSHTQIHDAERRCAAPRPLGHAARKVRASASRSRQPIPLRAVDGSVSYRKPAGAKVALEARPSSA